MSDDRSFAVQAATPTPFRPLTADQMAMVEMSPNPKLVLDREFRVRYVNLATMAYGSVDRALLIGRNIWDCYPALRGSIFHEAYQQVLDTGAPARFERHDPDRDRWELVYAYPADDGVIAVLEDVTDQRRLMEQLKQNEETLRLAQEAANIGSFFRDLRTGDSFWSDQLIRMLGFNPVGFNQARIGRDPQLDMVHPDDADAVREAWRRTIQSGESQIVRNRIVRADGAVRFLQSSTMVVRDQDGRPVKLVGTTLDITDQVRADEERQRIDAQMQQAQKLESLGVLAGGIAHDFNNLLVGILGNASLALLEMDPHHPARESLHDIERASQRAADLTRQLLAYAGKGRFIIEQLDASNVIGEMQALMRSAIARNTSLQFELGSPLPSIEVDANQFRQVVMTLITNASDSMADRPGVISVLTGRQEVSADYLAACAPGTTAAPGAYVFVEVRDTGIGMDAVTRQRMFEPFFSTKFTGRGLGLAATMGIMRSHHGAIRVYSEVGSGTSVKLLFPAIGVAAARQDATLPTLSTGHLLIVDDESSVRTVASALLRRRGFDVTESSDGQEASAVFTQDPERFALVLLDLTMPHMNGEETLRALRQLRPDIKVLLMSGYNETDVTRTFAGREVNGFLQKPFSAAELYNAVDRALS